MHTAEKKCIISSHKRIGRIIAIILVIIISVSTSFCTAFATQHMESRKNKIVVGYPLLESVNEKDSDGYYRGYDYEYLQEIARYTDWQYDFVVDTWDHCIQGLKDGTIDMMGFVSKTDERQQFLGYPNMPAGMASVLLIANEKNKKLSYGNLNTINGCRVGVLKGSTLEFLLDKFCAENNISVKKTYFETARMMRNALSAGRVELGLSTNFEVNDGTQIIYEISSDPFYFVVSRNCKNSQEKIDKLNDAVNKIFISDPNYNQNLYNTYIFSKSKKLLNFTDRERKFIKNSGNIKVVYDPNWAPLVYYDKRTGTMEGAMAYFFRRIEEDTGLKFEYIKKDNYMEALSSVRKGQALIITNFFKDYGQAEKYNVRLTKPYMRLPIELVTNEKTDSNKVALPRNYIPYYNLRQFGDSNQIVYFDNVNECYDALISGKARTTYSDAYMSSYMMGQRYYSDLKISPLSEENMEICLGINKNAPKELISILDKASLSITTEEVNQFAIKATLEAEDNSLGNWIYKNPNTAFCIAVTLFSIVFLIMLVYMMERRKREKALHYNLITGTWNYAKFCMEADRIFHKNGRNEDYVILHMNISRFRFLNDIYGFETGNEVLRAIAGVFAENAQKGELYGSLWADHFVCLIRCKSEEQLQSRLETVIGVLNERVVKVCDFRMVMRVGAYFVTPEDIETGKDANSMLQYANHALSSIRDSYKNIVACFDQSLDRKIQALKLVDKDMIKAFYNKEFIPYYQPKYNIYTKEVVGLEALIRWKHPSKGIMQPGDFLPYFEQSGFIIEVDLYIFEETCKNIRRWLNEGIIPVKVSCNFSRLHFENESFVKTVKGIAGKYDIPFHLLELELTETIAVEEMAVITKEIKELHDAGFGISIDDFGSGYSSLSVLQQLKVDTIKLDRTFLKNGIPTESEYKVMQSIINLAEQLQLNVICEGVETIEQVELLKQVHCDYAQGFYYAKPMSAERVDRLLKFKN
ncbi:EAL domain-containing protein [Aminipila terrae]|uniref:EAL domain-containing protein n=1 Tax=Aminipila terrae TaxID=2697030 RepID=A0A6P1MHG2_9FIRM|nr:EAL domain-containing protein [Aminipila terrae]QHI72024.1 EAL domain-containing protein [Aminipila terrae]